MNRASPPAQEGQSGTPGVDVSVVVPVSERPESLVDIYEEYSAPLKEARERFEFLYVAEPWYRELTAPVMALAAAGEPVRVLEVSQSLGETGLLRLAIPHCRGAIVLTLPAYRRVHALAVVDLLRCVRNGSDMAVARRWPRRDPWINRVQTKTLHVLLGRLGDGRIHDIGCGVRAMRREVLEAIPLYGDFARFLPLLALRDGYRVDEVDAPQHPAGRIPEASDRRVRPFFPAPLHREAIAILRVNR